MFAKQTCFSSTSPFHTWCNSSVKVIHEEPTTKGANNSRKHRNRDSRAQEVISLVFDCANQRNILSSCVNPLTKETDRQGNPQDLLIEVFPLSLAKHTHRVIIVIVCGTLWIGLW